MTQADEKVESSNNSTTEYPTLGQQLKTLLELQEKRAQAYSLLELYVCYFFKN